MDGWVTYHADPSHKLIIKPAPPESGPPHQSSCSCGQFRSEPGTLEEVTEQARQHRAQARHDITAAESLLNLRLDLDSESGARDVRGYFVELLVTLWWQGEGFSGKRPFGSSGWQYDIYTLMVKGGLIPGTVDEDGTVDLDERAADDLILRAIRHMGGMSPIRPRRIRAGA